MKMNDGQLSTLEPPRSSPPSAPPSSSIATEQRLPLRPRAVAVILVPPLPAARRHLRELPPAVLLDAHSHLAPVHVDRQRLAVVIADWPPCCQRALRRGLQRGRGLEEYSQMMCPPSIFPLSADFLRRIALSMRYAPMNMRKVMNCRACPTNA